MDAADSKDRLIEQLQKENAQLRQELELCQQQLRAALARVAELEAILRRHFPGSGGTPPPAHKPPKPAKPPKGRRRRGAQPGHKGHHRELLPLEQVTQIHTQLPSQCERCQEPLRGQDPQPLRHQVVEIPPLQPQVTEYRCHRLRCTACGHFTRAALPPGVPAGRFGPRLCGLVALCTGVYRLSKRSLEQLLRDLLGLKLSLGSVCALEQRVSQALQAPVQQALEALPQQGVANCDETGWRQSHHKAWLWVVVTAACTVFRIAKSRGADVVKQLLGPGYGGTLGSDRWSAYRFVPLGQRQLCWAHLLRDFQELVDAGGDGARLGKELLRLGRRVMRQWHRVRDGTRPLEQLARRLKPVRRALEASLRMGAMYFTGKARALSRELLRQERALWRFTLVEGVEPTNNSAERALRHAVLWRRSSFGTQSPQGSLFVERILTVRATLRQQGRCVLTYLTQACTAALHHQPPPSLLPLAACPACAG